MTRQKNNLRLSYCAPTPSVTTRETDTNVSRTVNIETTFGILVGCVLIYYIPFYTVATYRSFNGLDSVPENVLTTVTWIGSANR